MDEKRFQDRSKRYRTKYLENFKKLYGDTPLDEQQYAKVKRFLDMTTRIVVKDTIDCRETMEAKDGLQAGQHTNGSL